MAHPMTKEERFAKRKYWQMIKRYRKQLKKMAKNWNPWDWSYAVEMFIECVKGMREYYSQTYNVWALESEDGPSRLQICDYILDKWNAYNSASWDDELYRWDEMWRLVSGYMLELWD